MVYKREVFNEQQFDENLLGYTVVEDMDFRTDSINITLPRCFSPRMHI